MTAVCDEVLTQTRVTIQALGLTGITSANIVDLLVGDDQGGSGPQIAAYPCIICCYAQPESSVVYSNTRDERTYPVSVVIISTENGAQTTNRARNLTWRQSITRAFNQKRLTGITGGDANPCRVRPVTVADRPRWLQQQHAQVLVVEVPVIEVRT